jgi:hypothetical protein
LTVKVFRFVGDLLMLAGIIVVLAPVLARMMGQFYVLGFELSTVLLGGVALLVLACLAKLELLLRK